MKQPGFFDLPDHMKRLSDAGDPLETVVRVDLAPFYDPVLS
jgi:hypothetical protein